MELRTAEVDDDVVEDVEEDEFPELVDMLPDDLPDDIELPELTDLPDDETDVDDRPVLTGMVTEPLLPEFTDVLILLWVDVVF